MSNKKVHVTVAHSIRLAGMRVAADTKYNEMVYLEVTDNITGDDEKIYVVGPEETVQVPAKLDLIIVEIPWFGTMKKKAPSRIYGYFEIKYVLGISPVVDYFSYGTVEKESPPLKFILENLEKAQIPVSLCQFSETIRREFPHIG